MNSKFMQHSHNISNALDMLSLVACKQECLLTDA